MAMGQGAPGGEWRSGPSHRESRNAISGSGVPSVCGLEDRMGQVERAGTTPRREIGNFAKSVQPIAFDSMGASDPSIGGSGRDEGETFLLFPWIETGELEIGEED
jgi:hypothetical protein